MFTFMQNPYVFGFMVALVGALLMYAYQYTVEPDSENNKKTFYKSLATGVLAALIVTYIVHRPEKVSSEPFTADTGAASTPTTATPAQ